ncbi:MAG: ankyrin repeat domain-containing protein, partial [Alphaproteobacteria bacterium]
MKRFGLLGFLCILGMFLPTSPSNAAGYYADKIYSVASSGNISSLQRAKSRGIDMDSTDRYGDTAICKAIKNNDYHAYRTLDLVGADTSPRCIKRISKYRLEHFEKVYSSYYGGSFGAGISSNLAWGTAAVLGVGGAAAGIAAAAGGGGGGSKSKKSDEDEEEKQRQICEKEPCTRGCYEDITCPLDSICISFNNCGGCTKCRSLNPNIPNCRTYKSDNSCAECRVNYVPSADGLSCESTLNDCDGYPLQTCSSNGICSSCTTRSGKVSYRLDRCEDNYKMTGAECVKDCSSYTLNKCPDNAVCGKCEEDGKTTYKTIGCNTGYILDNGVCYQDCSTYQLSV